MKKTLFVTLSILIAVSSLAFAGCKPGFGPGCGGKGDFPAMMDKELKDLNLTPAQKAKLDEIKTDIRNDMKAYREQMKVMRSEVDKELSKDTPDVNAVAADIKQKLSAVENPGVKMVDYFTKFYNTLDAKQQKQLVEKMKTWSKKCPGRCFDDPGDCRRPCRCPMAGR